KLHALVTLAFRRGEDVEGDEELRPVGAVLVDVLEDGGRFVAEVRVLEEELERLARTLVLRVEEEDLAVVLERAGGIADVLLERLPEPELEVDDLALVVIELDATAERVDVRLPALEVPVKDIERLQRVRVGGLVVEDAVVRVDRAIEVLHLGLVELRDLVRDL